MLKKLNFKTNKKTNKQTNKQTKTKSEYRWRIANRSPLFLQHYGIGHLKRLTAPWFETCTECIKAFTLQTDSEQISGKNKWSIFCQRLKCGL